ncbi:MAG: hypothetical protein QXV17_15150 [Candidatus Micrarchaeaceae archaeon]
MTIGKEEIKKSRKKLGISEPDKPNKIVCEAYGCSKIATGKCKYCNRYFCSYHLNPTISMSASYVRSLDGSDYEKYKKYNEDWQRKDGHPCVPYTEWWNENHIKQQREHYKEMNKAWDILFEGVGSSSKGENTSRSNSSRFTEYRPSLDDKRGISSETYTTKRNAATYPAKIILILLAILILGTLSLHFSSYLRSSSGSLNQNRSMINGTWATEFFSNVSSERGMPYAYCANLSDFASKRFHTMAQHYGVSHYGYAADFNSTWPGGVEYEGEIYEGFGEEVFYPSGYNASNYVQYIITNAPLHWQELADKNFTSYGYNISNGPAYEILGPDGGYSECPVTEIPGPNINISQYFAQYGCSVETTNLTYFVIEIAPFCPYKGT